MDYNALLIVMLAEKQQEVLDLRAEIDRLKSGAQDA